MTVAEKLANVDAYLYRDDLFALGLGRRAVDAVFRDIGEQIPGYGRPVIRVGRWLDYRESFTYKGNRPRPGRA